MTNINTVNSAAAPQQASQSSATQPGTMNGMDSDAFMQMLLAQLQYQDPTKPMDSSEMVSQMSDLTMIESMSDMKDTISQLGNQLYSSQSLYASTLVGQGVSVLANVIDIEEGDTVSGKVLLPTTADDLNIEIRNENDDLVATLPLGEQTETGEIEFDLANLGDELPAGKYTLKAVTTIDGNESEAAITQDTTVTGVVIPGPGQEVLVEVDNVGLVPLSYITRLNGNEGAVAQSKSNSFFNRELLEQFEGLGESGIVDSGQQSQSALPPSPASVAIAASGNNEALA